MDRILNEAVDTAARYGTEDLDLLAQQMGVGVYDLLESENLKELYLPELKAIALRPKLPNHERRYLLAHALGHHLLHQDEAPRDHLRSHLEETNKTRNPDRAKIAQQECEANLFASYLLIPDSALKPELDRVSGGMNDEVILQLAIEFSVPTEAIRVRLVFEQCRNLSN